MNRFYAMVAVLVLCSALLACARSGHSEDKVLFIFSYHAEYPWVVEETLGAEEILKQRGVEIETFYMDTKRKASEEWKAHVAEDAVKEIDDFNPDVVIVFDDNACELVAKRYVGKNLPFIFCGMNGEPEDYGFPAENITGVIERHDLNETLGFLKLLVPDVEKAAIMTDISPTSQAFVSRARTVELPIEMHEVYGTSDFDAWKQKVAELQSKVDAIGLFTYHTIKEAGGEESLPPEDVLRWTLSNNRLPEFTFFDFSVNDGALCGVTQSGYEQGKAAAEMAIKILDGENPADIPITSPVKGKPIVNQGRANELGIVVPTDVLNEVEMVR